MILPLVCPDSSRSSSRNDIRTGVLDETFSTTKDGFGELITVDFKPGGSRIPVTEKNKREYVGLAFRFRTFGRIKEQFDAFIGGFFEVVPGIDEQELEFLFGGIADIDVCIFKVSGLFSN